MFKDFKKAIKDKLDYLIKNSEYLYQVATDKDEFWNLYLDSFPEGTNDIYKIQRKYDCSCCRHFIKYYGNIVGIIDNKKVSIWDVKVEGYYQTVADALAQKIKSSPISDVFFSKEQSLGTDFNRVMIEDTIHTWEHFYYQLPASYVDTSSDSIASLKSEIKQTKQVISRSFLDLKIEAIETVLDLIKAKALYRGEEHKGVLLQFQKLQKKCSQVQDKDLFCWTTAVKHGRLAAIRNTAIGTLLLDLSNGTPIEDAIGKYEALVAPVNYKRPKAVFTKGMVKEAESKMKELGLLDSLHRRHAQLEDISIQNVLWASGESKKVMSNPFDDLLADVKERPKSFDYAEEMEVEDFVENVLPIANNIELLLDNKHQANLVSLIAPKSADSPSLFKWDNGFSWAYTGNVTDSIKESVKARGGNVEGALRFSLSWAEGDRSDNSDLDAHCILPNRMHIHYRHKNDRGSGGMLDVDITNPNHQKNKDIVENIVWSKRNKMPKGDYRFFVNNYSLRGTQKGFTAEIEFDGKVYTFEYDKPMRNGENVDVAIVHFDGKKFSIKKSLPSNESSKQIWGLKTMQFVPVSTFMYSPNHWDEQGVGNRHYFFFLENCVNPDTLRGFFNEYLRNDLDKHKRVFEALGNKMQVAHSDNQLSGLGFSSTLKNTVTLKIDSKPVNIKF